jgi:hypothetical protein
MKYKQTILSFLASPADLEALYQKAVQEQETSEFHKDIQACYTGSPDNVLLAAWYYRLEAEPQRRAAASEPTQIAAPTRHPVQWKFAVPLAILNGLLFWLLSDPDMVFSGPYEQIPYLVVLATPIIAILVVIYLSWSVYSVDKQNSGRLWKTAGIPLLILIAITIYAFVLCLNPQTFEEGQYRTLAVVHLPLLSWGAVGWAILGLRSAAHQRFCFLIKSIEIFVVAGLILIVGLIFGAITLGLFSALTVEIPELLMRLMAAGGAGLIPLLAVAIGYDPFKTPAEQDFSQGLSKLVALIPRLLLPLVLVVLVVYILVIPFFFIQPFTDRDVLIVYNIMLFAVMGLLVGSTPIHQEELSPRLQNLLRLGLFILISLVILVSLYALSATAYRTIQGGLTMNRLTILGWNTLNITLLALMLVRGLRAAKEPALNGVKGNWAGSFQSVFGLACACYLVWSAFLLLVMPWLF